MNNSSNGDTVVREKLVNIQKGYWTFFAYTVFVIRIITMAKVTCARIMASLIVGALLIGFGCSVVISQWTESIPFALLGCALTLLGVVFVLKPCIDTHCQRNIDDHGPNCKCAESTKARKRAAAARRCGKTAAGSTCGSSCAKQSRQRTDAAKSDGKQPGPSGRDSPNPNEDNMINSRLDMMAISAKFGLRTRLETLPEEDSSNLDLSEPSPQEDNETTLEEGQTNKFVPTSV